MNWIDKLERRFGRYGIPYLVNGLIIGQLAVGKCADLFLVDSRRLELVGGAYSPADVLATVGLRGPVDYTVVNGRVVVKEGHLVTIDEEKTAADARNACGAYLAKA